MLLVSFPRGTVKVDTGLTAHDLYGRINRIFSCRYDADPVPEDLQCQRIKACIDHHQRKTGWQILLFYQLEAVLFIEAMSS